jgi:glycine betaine transporter
VAMRGSLGSTIDPGVFWISLGISMLFVLWGVLFTDNLATVASVVLGWLIASFGWVFILASFGFLAFVIFLAFSRYGKVRLGRDDDEPERAAARPTGAAPQQASSLEREPGR